MKKTKKIWMDYSPGGYLLTALCILAAVLLLAGAKNISSGMRQGLALCANVVIPSLFPFMALSGFVATSRVSLVLNRLLRPITKYVLRLPDHAASPLLMGFIGGYPVGARTLGSLVREKRLSTRTAGRMLCFCVNAGPPFLLSAVGVGMLGSLQLGLLLLVAQVASALIIGIALGLTAPREEIQAATPQGFRPYSYCFVQSVGDAASALIPICAFVTLFSAIGAVLQSSGALNFCAGVLDSLLPSLGEDASRALLIGLLEVTNGCQAASSAGRGGVLVVAALISLSGVSVLFQVMAAVHGSGIPLKGFFISRLFHGALTLLLFLLLLRLFPQALSVFGNAVQPLKAVSNTASGSISLLIMCGVFLISAGRRLPGLR